MSKQCSREKKEEGEPKLSADDFKRNVKKCNISLLVASAPTQFVTLLVLKPKFLTSKRFQCWFHFSPSVAVHLLRPARQETHQAHSHPCQPQGSENVTLNKTAVDSKHQVEKGFLIPSTRTQRQNTCKMWVLSHTTPAQDALLL